jgi:holo-[acyl-carrier protein] synthase
MIFGVGIDLIEVARIARQVSAGRRFADRVFTEQEITYCEGKKNKAQNYAARFAAKEAFLKAVGMGWRMGLAFKDIEVVNNSLGKPELVLYGKARELAEKIHITNIQVSLTHLKEMAGAFVVLETD